MPTKVSAQQSKAQLSSSERVQYARDRIWADCDAAAIVAAGSDQSSVIVAGLTRQFLKEREPDLQDDLMESVVSEVVALTLGLGPIEVLLQDPTVSEIMVNGSDDIFVERDGVIERTGIRFDDDDHVLRTLDRMLAPIGRRIDARSPMVDARLADGSRVNAIIPPLAIDGPLITIRRFIATARSLDDLLKYRSCTPQQAGTIRQLIADRQNVIVAGGTGSGKTTLLAAALHHSGPNERIVVIEDAAEIPLEHGHALRLESRPAAADGSSEVRIRDLVKNALRMRPDRIVIGEMRGDEAFDVMQALNTGHGGCWSTVHANSAIEALHRIESMIMCAGVGMPPAIARSNLNTAIDAVLYVERGHTGTRTISSINRVHLVDGEWELHEISSNSSD